MKIIIIGCTGLYKCYINMTKSQAIEEHKKDEPLDFDEHKNLKSYLHIDELKIENNKFGAYDIWELKTKLK